MSTLTKEEVIAKLQKILSRAAEGRGNTEAEMNIAMAKARALAIEHSIDLSSVSVDGKIEVESMETDWAETHTKTKQEQPYHMPIVWTVQQVFGCHPVLSTYTDHNQMRHITRITWIGEKTDVALAVYCWNFLETLFPKCWLEYRKANGIADNYVSKRSYFHGLFSGIVSANKRAEQAMAGNVKDRYALVVVKKEALVAARKEKMFPNTGKLRSFRTADDAGARAAGHAKGSTIKLSGGLSNGSSKQSLT